MNHPPQVIRLFRPDANAQLSALRTLLAAHPGGDNGESSDADTSEPNAKEPNVSKAPRDVNDNDQSVREQGMKKG